MSLNKFWLGAIALLSLLLAASIGLNILLYNRASKYYLELNQTRLDPYGIDRYRDDRQTTENSEKLRVVLFGDSRAADWVVPDNNRYQFINRGIGSQTSIQTLGRFEKHVRSLEPEIVIIQVGINDLKTIALFPERRESIVTNLREHLTALVEASRELGAVAIVTTIFPVGPVPLQRQPFWSDEIEKATIEVNDYIKTLAGENVVVFDTFTVFADDRGLMFADYRKDELHVNDRGYAQLNRELLQLLDRLKLERSGRETIQLQSPPHQVDRRDV
ncbi:MAG: SGNH/GDSL hydrolase family protein [Cyanobacteria bacterium J007]|nr:MAG: SGNH/GDSL hydrolase family protein [Cyanobacteria bacterium J007]